MMILAVVVTYYPEKETLENNINSIIHFVDKVLIWENTPDFEKQNYRLHTHEKIEYYGDGINSISHGLNFAYRYAKENGYDYLLTMDQDSVFHNFDYYVKQTICNQDAPVGLWTPCINDKETIGDFEIIEMPITSGMLASISMIDKIGGWNEYFTVDSVDDEFYLYANSVSINTYIVKGVKMKQQFGCPHKVIFMNHTITLRNYSPSRLYNIYRNSLLLIRSYPSFSYIKKNFISCWIKQIFWIILFESDRPRKMYAIAKGILFGLFCNLKMSLRSIE